MLFGGLARGRRERGEEKEGGEDCSSLPLASAAASNWIVARDKTGGMLEYGKKKRGGGIRKRERGRKFGGVGIIPLPMRGDV